MTVFALLCLSAALLYALATLLPEAIPLWQASEETRFTLSSVFILLTLAVIPTSLRLFRFGYVERCLYIYKEKALLRWGLLRLLLLGGLLLTNLLLYYLLGEEPTFGWLSLIIVLVLPFVVPTMGRCRAETTPPETQKETTPTDQTEA